MAHFFSFSNDPWNPKRMLFRKSNNLPEGQRRLQNERGRDAQEQQLQWELEGLSKDVTRGQIQDSLGRLDQNISHRELMQQDEHEMTRLTQQVDGNTLEDEETREVFFGNVEQRLTVLLVMLIRSRQLNYREFTTGNQQTLLDDVRSRKDQMRIDVQGRAPRELLPQEKSILDLITRLPNHALPKVKESWGILLEELKGNVQAMNFATDIVLADANGQPIEPPPGLSETQRGVWDQIKESWEQRSNIEKGIVVAASIFTAWRFYKFVSDRVSGSSNNGVGKTLLDIGALVAGGAFIAGGVMGVEKSWEMLSGVLTGFGLSQVAFFLGVKAMLSGNWEEAKRQWGDAWGILSERFGIGDAARRMTETTERGMEWLNKHTDFAGMKGKIETFFTSKGMPVPEWFSNMSLANVARDMGVEQGSLETWSKYAGLGGAAFLIYRWMGKKGLVMNAAVYLLLVKEGKNSFGGEMIGDMADKITQSKNRLIESLKGQFPGVEYLIPDAFENFDLGNSADELLEWAGENPVEAMLGINAMWICRGIIFRTLKMMLVNGGRFVWNNPGKAALGAASIAALWSARREFINQFVEVSYDDPHGVDALRMRVWLDNLTGVDRSRSETLWEKQVPEYAKSILEDPLRMLNLTENIERYQRGEFSIIVDGGGKIGLLFRGASAPVQCAKLTWETLKSIPYIFSQENDQGYVWPMVVAGTEMYVFGSAAWGGFDAYRTVMTSGEGRLHNIKRGIKSLVPGTAEWRFVFKSTLEAPFIPILKRFKAYEIAKITAEIEKIKAFMGSTPNFSEIRKISEALSSNPIFEDIAALRKGLGGGTNFSYKYAQEVTKIEETLKSITAAAKTENTNDIVRLISSAEEDILKYKTSISGFLERFELLITGHFKEAFALRSSMKEMRALRAAQAAGGADAARGASFIDNIDDTARAGSFMDNADDLARARTFLDEGADATRAGNVATEVARTGSMRAAADELLRVSRGATTIHPAQIEGLRSLANSNPDDLRAALRALDLGDEQITAAMRTLATTDRSHVQLFAALQEARILPDTASLRVAITESAELSEAMRILSQGGDLRPAHFEALRQLGQLDEAADALRAAGVPAATANEVAATLRTESSLARIVSRISSALPTVRIPFASGLLRIGRCLAPAVTVVGAPLGAAFAIYEARQQFIIAQEFKNNPDVVDYLEAKAYTTGTVGVVGLAADVGITIAVGASAAAVPLILLTGSLLLIQEGVTSALEAAAEQEMESEDFLLLAMREGQKVSGVRPPQIPEGQRPTPEQARDLMLASLRIQDQAKRYLLHQWYTTGDDLQMGERTLAAYTFWTTEELHEGRGNTRSDMILALIKLDTPTELQSNADYMSYRFSYIASQTADLNADSYAQAQSLLAQSKIFADTMKVRESDGVGVVYRYQEGPGTYRDIDISRPEYNPSNIAAVDVNAIYIAATRANNDALIQELGGGAEGMALLRRLNHLDPNYIQFALNVLESYLVINIDQKGQDRYDRLDRLSTMLQIWAGSLGVAFAKDLEVDPTYEENLDGVVHVLTSSTISEADLNRELAGRLPNSPGTAVFYTLAQYFGYSGSPNIALLQRFFNERNAMRTGVYWDGSNWRVNERWDYDDNSWRSWVPLTDDETTNNAALRVIEAFKAEPNEVIESTRDSSIDLHTRDDLLKRIRMVNALADRMQSAYDSTRQRLGGEGVTTDTQRSAVAAGVESLASDAQSGFSTIGEAFTGNTTGLRMAGEQAAEEISGLARDAGSGFSTIGNAITGDATGLRMAGEQVREIARPVTNYIEAVQERGIDWDRTLKPWKW